MLSSKNLYNKRVYANDKKKSVGRIRAFVFYEKTCVAFLVKRPDFLWMFHRKPAYINFNECQIKKDGVWITSKSLLSKNNKNLISNNKSEENLVMWLEMPVMLGKQKFGYVGSIDFDEKSGEIVKIGLTQGVVSGVVLGKAEILTEDIVGYSHSSKAIMLKNGAAIRESKKGAAEKAGKATSYVVHKVKTTTPKVIDSMQEQSDKIHDMFHDFKDEFKKGMEE